MSRRKDKPRPVTHIYDLVCWMLKIRGHSEGLGGGGGNEAADQVAEGDW